MYKISEPIIFDTIDLNTVPGIIITGYSTYNPPSNNLSIAAIALDNRSMTVSRNEQAKKIIISGLIIRTDRIFLETSLDTLNGIIKKINKLLNVPLRNSRYEFRNVSYSNMVIEDVKGGMAKFSIEFICSDPYSYDTLLTTALPSTNITGIPQSLLVNFTGNTEQVPIITINAFVLEPETTEKSITITNPVTNESVSINRVFTDGEVIIFNCDTRKITVNGIDVDYSGILFEVNPTVTALTINDTFTTRNFNIKIEYYKRFI